jgi:hypothetical protein
VNATSIELRSASIVINRDSPDESQTGINVRIFSGPLARQTRGADRYQHLGYRLMARRDPLSIRLLTRNGHEWAPRYPSVRRDSGDE